ncbi:hypothetical protein [Sagittula salina]|uniref:Uncharacterized protein n=1 Tax=Sagittula salina TaxID=2820268 RepID=A0A940MU26_9RHOB|nr:hypothetical protein [Sagittula salina]MBP0484673.1 hypothetical protein [Sagittula salina]
MRISIDTFKGAIPKLDDTKLPPQAATLARNCGVESGALAPLHESILLQAGAVADFHLHKGEILTFAARTSVAPGPVASDRLYIMAEGTDPVMKVMPAGTEYPLAVPYPNAPPSVGIAVAAPEPEPEYLRDDNNDIVLSESGDPVILVDAIPLEVETMVFAYTWVTVFDEESLPSPPSADIDVTEGSTVAIGFPDAPPSGSRIDRLRVYRAVTGASGTTDFLFIKELNTGAASYVYDAEADPTQEPIPSTFYDPPISGLHGLTAMQNGMMAAFKGRELYFCEPFRPHAWPAGYMLTTDYDIVALVAMGSTLGVLTAGTPYRINGSAPENMQMERLEINAPCVSADSVVDFGHSAFYATWDGLVTISPGGADVVSAGLFSRETWRAMDPATMRAGRYDGAYVFTYTAGGQARTGILDLADGAAGWIETDTVAAVLRHDIASGALHYADGTGIHEFDPATGSPRALVWRSGIAALTMPTTFAAARFEGEALGADEADTGFSARIYRDGALLHTVTALNTSLRLPDGKGTRWQIEIEGKVKITRATIAGSMRELIG